VDITATYSSIVYCDENIIGGCKRGFRLLLEFDVEGFVENEGKILFDHVSISTNDVNVKETTYALLCHCDSD
jgi:hypothetical protein